MPSRRRERPSHRFSVQGVQRAFHAPGFTVEEPQVVVHEADQPDLLGNPADADCLTCEVHFEPALMKPAPKLLDEVIAGVGLEVAPELVAVGRATAPPSPFGTRMFL